MVESCPRGTVIGAVWDTAACVGAWRSLVARTVRVGEVPSSNLGAPIVLVRTNRTEQQEKSPKTLGIARIGSPVFGAVRWMIHRKTTAAGRKSTAKAPQRNLRGGGRWAADARAGRASVVAGPGARGLSPERRVSLGVYWDRAELGWDCAGALQILEAKRISETPSVRWLDTNELDALIEELPRYPLGIHARDERLQVVALPLDARSNAGRRRRASRGRCRRPAQTASPASQQRSQSVAAIRRGVRRWPARALTTRLHTAHSRRSPPGRRWRAGARSHSTTHSPPWCAAW